MSSPNSGLSFSCLTEEGRRNLNKMPLNLLGNVTKRKTEFKITGSYVLDHYDENLERWLESLDIKGEEIGKTFRDSKVKVIVQEPSKYNNKWSLTHKEEGETDTDKITSYSFECGKGFDHMENSEHIQHIECQNVSSNILSCNSEVKEMNWKISTKIMFTPDGIVLTVTNEDRNVSMTAFYSKSQDPWTLKRAKLRMLKFF